MRKGIFILSMFFLLISISFAQVSDTPGATFEDSVGQSSANKPGVMIRSMNNSINLSLVNITKFVSSDADILFIQDCNTSTITNYSVIGNAAQVENVILDSFHYYSIAFSGTGSWTTYYDQQNYPIAGTNVRFIGTDGGFDCTKTTGSTYTHNLVLVITEYYEEEEESITFTLTTDLQNETVVYDGLYTNITFNGTFTGEDTDLANCSFYVNRNGEAWTENLTFINVNMSNNQEIGYNYGFIAGYIDLKINCTSQGENRDSGVYRHTLDTTVYYNYLLITEVRNDVKQIYGWFEMIPMIIIWALLTIGSLKLMLMGQKLAGTLIYVFTTGFDLFITGWIFNTYSSLANNSTYYGFTVAMLMVTIAAYYIIKIWVPIALVKTTRT